MKDLEREFGRFGAIERIRIVSNPFADDKAPKKKKMRGYAFIVFEREADMKGTFSNTSNYRNQQLTNRIQLPTRKPTEYA